MKRRVEHAGVVRNKWQQACASFSVILFLPADPSVTSTFFLDSDLFFVIFLKSILVPLSCIFMCWRNRSFGISGENGSDGNKVKKQIYMLLNHGDEDGEEKHKTWPKKQKS